MEKDKYDVIVVGAGHAGCEAAHAAARMGRATLLITLDPDKIGLMSCNPAVGGMGKGQLVKELDAMGGLMARVTDMTSLHYRKLNTKKGKAVHSSRAQVDREAYRREMGKLLESAENLDIEQGEVVRLLVEGGGVRGVETSGGKTYLAQTVVLNCGTFLNGVIHMGLENFRAGRMDGILHANLART